MKNLFCFFLMLMMISSATFAQVAVNIDGAAPDSSAMLDVKSTAKGFLAPRMTFTEMNSIISPASGLMVFCTTTGQYYFNNGTPAAPNWVGSFILPFSGSFSSYSTLLDLTNTGYGYVGTFIINNPASYASALYAETNGPGWTITSYNTGSTNGFAGYFRNTSPTNSWPAIQGKTAGAGPVFRAFQNLGPGGGLDVHMQYASSTAAGIAVYNDALGNACQFFLNNAASTASALHAENNGSGDVGFFQTNSPSGSNAAVKGRAINVGGGGGAFEVFNADNPNTAIYGTTQGTGSAGALTIDNASNNAAALYLGTNGGGSAIHAENSGSGNAHAGYFINNNPANSFPAVQGKTEGAGSAFRAVQDSGPGPGMDVYMWNPNNTAPGIAVEQHALGNAGQFIIYNNSNTANAVYGETNRGTPIFAHKTGGVENEALLATNDAPGGNGIVGIVNNPSNTFPAALMMTQGMGHAGRFIAFNPLNNEPCLTSETYGTGNAGKFKIMNTSNTNAAIYAETNGTGAAIYAQTTGTGTAIQGTNQGATNGFAAFFNNTNPANNFPAVQGYTTGGGSVFRAMQETSTGPGVDIYMCNASSSAEGIKVDQLGLGNAGQFIINKTSNAATGVYVETNGTGTALIANHTGNTGNIAIFRSSSTNKARIDKTGKGFFNGGTQTGGADVAELFDVEGPVDNYEAGDVMVISESSDRTMEKSTEPVSTRVAGVYATKPGVILTEKDIEDNLDQLVPVGMIGVIPTKVCDENGPIKRGDLLVTSSKPGHAMKATPVKINGMLIYPTGAILGKALENFEKGGQGLIKVLVNVK